MTYAKVIADSVSPTHDRLTTFEVELHRFVLAELLTHRAFSRNGASSRAIPLKKSIFLTTARPAVWASEQKGMQGGEEISEVDQRHANAIWNSARDQAIHHAEELAKHGVHKSICNRLLEPFMWHRVIITTTMPGLDNFFDLRIADDAMPELRLAAEAMRDVIRESKPKPVGYGEWHLPYITDEDRKSDVGRYRDGLGLRQISAARCARVSYLTHDGKRDLAKDLELYSKLVEAKPKPHASPLEHVATPNEYYGPYGAVGNFGTWRQLRHEVLFP